MAKDSKGLQSETRKESVLDRTNWHRRCRKGFEGPGEQQLEMDFSEAV